jgi:glycine/D-amino acid oxidase-like deaminating enzyme/nitrite reductase/ring-hydroxylating ferredoxin subunit
MHDRHHPVWVDPAATPEVSRLDRDLDVDVLVIGAGITGLTTALLLQREGSSVAVIERHLLARGATSHSSGHLTAALDVPYHVLVSRFGRDDARAVCAASLAAIDTIGRLSVEVGVDAGLAHLPGYRYSLRREDVAELEREAELARELGLPATLVRETPLPVPVAAAIRFDDQAMLNPVRYVAGLARAFLAGGGALYQDTAVLEIEDGEPCHVRTSRHEVRARSVVQATHVPLGRVVSVQARLAPSMSYVLSARLAQPAPVALFWDTDDPYHYLRPLAPGSDLLIAGGRDHKTGQAGDGFLRFQQLEEHVRERGFDILQVEQRWSWEVFEPADGLPYVGRQGDGHVFLATGYAGTGLTFGTLAAEILRDLVRGGDHPLAHVLSPSRAKPLASSRDVLRETANNAWHLVRDRLAGPDVSSAAAIGRGEGALIELDNHRAAVHRDQAGELHVMSPVCTHMGCIVQWNAAAATWDCPCHGSRFLPGGDVLSGPAVNGLTDPAA